MCVCTSSDTIRIQVTSAQCLDKSLPGGVLVMKEWKLGTSITTGGRSRLSRLGGGVARGWGARGGRWLSGKFQFCYFSFDSVEDATLFLNIRGNIRVILRDFGLTNISILWSNNKLAGGGGVADVLTSIFSTLGFSVSLPKKRSGLQQGRRGGIDRDRLLHKRSKPLPYILPGLMLKAAKLV